MFSLFFSQTLFYFACVYTSVCLCVCYYIVCGMDY